MGWWWYDGSSSACTISFYCLVFVDRLQFHVFHGLIYLFSSHTYSYCVLFPVSYWSGLCTLIYSWLEKNKFFISMACRALFVMLPVFWVINFQMIWMNTLCIYMNYVFLAILVNESKYRPLITCFTESPLFFFFFLFFWLWTCFTRKSKNIQVAYK